MKKPACLLLLALGALAPLSAVAKPYHYTPVRWIVETRNKLSEDDKYVTIIGHVTRRIGDNEYWFTDGTASIRLDSEDFDLPIGERIVVGGRIDQAYWGIGHLEVDVTRWHHAPLHPGVAHAQPTPPPASAAVKTPTPPAPAPTPAPAAAPAPAPAPAPSLAPAPEPTPAPAPAPAASTNAAPAPAASATTTNATPPAAH